MFKWNDKYFYLAQKVFSVLLIVLPVVELICIIVLSILVSPIYLWLLPLIVIEVLLIYLACNLYFSFMCDVKLIRNKLYNSDNTSLKNNINDFWNITDETEPTAAEHERQYDTEKQQKSDNIIINDERLLELCLAAGFITEEEYRKYLNSDANNSSNEFDKDKKETDASE